MYTGLCSGFIPISLSELGVTAVPVLQENKLRNYVAWVRGRSGKSTQGCVNLRLPYLIWQPLATCELTNFKFKLTES